MSTTNGENTGTYATGRKWSGNAACKTCGVHLYGNLWGPPKEFLEALSEEKKEFVRGVMDVKPVNIRVLDGVEWDQLKIVRDDCGTEGYTLPD